MTLEQEIIHWKNMVKLYKFDYLTGLKQRHDFEVETIHKMTNQRFWLMMSDISGLHAINRDKGYAAGDALVRQVANDIQHSEGLWECYRVGGDEFMSLFFEEPQIAVLNSTCCYVDSGNFEYFSDMVDAVDRLVIDKKAKLKRRRSDD